MTNEEQLRKMLMELYDLRPSTADKCIEICKIIANIAEIEFHARGGPLTYIPE